MLRPKGNDIFAISAKTNRNSILCCINEDILSNLGGRRV